MLINSINSLYITKIANEYKQKDNILKQNLKIFIAQNIDFLNTYKENDNIIILHKNYKSEEYALKYFKKDDEHILCYNKNNTNYYLNYSINKNEIDIKIIDCYFYNIFI